MNVETLKIMAQQQSDLNRRDQNESLEGGGKKKGQYPKITSNKISTVTCYLLLER